MGFARSSTISASLPSANSRSVPNRTFPVAGILADHVHLVLGCAIQVAPDEVVLGFLNNLAFVQGMRPIYQFGGFVGTVGEYTTNAW